MTGGAGPAHTLHPPVDRPASGRSGYQTSWRDLEQPQQSRSHSRGRRLSVPSGRRAPTPHRSAREAPHERSRSQSRRRTHGPQNKGKREATPHPSRHRHRRHHSPRAYREHRHHPQSRSNPSHQHTNRTSASASPTQHLPRGPDGTLFGSLPKYKFKAGLALGFGAHVMRTYRHIKAEHEAGHRKRSFIENKMDELRGKGRGRRVERSRDGRRSERLRKSEGRGEERRRGDRLERRERGHSRDGGTPVPEIRVQAPMNTERPRRKPVPVRRERSTSARSIGLDGGEGSVQHPPREVSPSARSVGLDEQQAPVEPPRPATPHEISPSTRPVSLNERQAPDEPPRPDAPSEHSLSVRSLNLDRRQSPIEPLGTDTHSLVETIDTSRASSPIMSQAPPPPPLPPPGNHPLPPPKHASMVALLSDIKGGFKLRKVTNSEKKEHSMNPIGERVVYDETPHSRDVEERERAQLAESSTAASTTTKADPNRAFQEDLMKALKRRGSRQVTEHECARELRRDSIDSSLTADSRTSMMVNVSRHLQEQSMLVMFVLRCA